MKSSKTWQALQAFADEAFSLRTRSVDRAKDVELYLNFQHWVESSAFFHLTMSGVLEPPIVSRSYDGNRPPFASSHQCSYLHLPSPKEMLRLLAANAIVGMWLNRLYSFESPRHLMA